MKKIFSFFAAALMSVSMFASVDSIPSDQVLADYYESGQLCVCVYFQGEVCNDIVWVGSYYAEGTSWKTDVDNLAKFEEVDGYEGWYVVAVDDASESIEGKPVQLKSDGSFDWSYQTGDAESWTLIRGSVNIVAGYAGEANLKGWSTAQPNVLISAYWKNQGSPCVTIPTHDYKIVLDAPLCEGPDKETYAPAIIGDFNGWSEGVPMVLNENTLKYEYTIVKGEEGKSYKFKATTDTDWSNQIQGYDTETSEWKDLGNSVLPVCSKDTTIEIDFSDGAKYKYTKCGQEPEPLKVDTLDNSAATVTGKKIAYADGKIAWNENSANPAENTAVWTVLLAVEGDYEVVLNEDGGGSGHQYMVTFAKAGADVATYSEPAGSWEVGDISLGKLTLAAGEYTVTLMNAMQWSASAVKYFILKQYDATALAEIAAQATTAKKVMIDGKMYILVNGVAYDVMGAVVK